MAESVTKLQKTIDKAEKQTAALRAKIAQMKEENIGAVETATRTATTLGGAFATAWMMGRYPDRQEILGIDASLAIGGAATVAAMMGWAGDQELFVEALGTGALSVYAVRKGFEMGDKSFKEAA